MSNTYSYERRPQWAIGLNPTSWGLMVEYERGYRRALYDRLDMETNEALEASDLAAQLHLLEMAEG